MNLFEITLMDKYKAHIQGLVFLQGGGLYIWYSEGLKNTTTPQMGLFTTPTIII